MTGDPLPDNDHFARYCRPQQIRNERPAVSAFVPRANEDHLSVNWLEFFDANSLGLAVARVREASARSSAWVSAGDSPS